MMYSTAYIEHLKRGPFWGRTDPWAEAGRYFQQLHSEIISHLLVQMQDSLLAMGYIAGRETSLQIAENRQPDVFIRRSPTASKSLMQWDYGLAAEGVLAEAGVLLEGIEPELDALYIKNLQTGELVTVVEIVSPRNKTDISTIREYQERRERLRREAVNVVEVDITRSVKRLTQDALLERYPYHVAIYLCDQPPRFIGMDFGQALKRCALPLWAEVIAVELQAAYDHAYRLTSLAGHIHNETGYSQDALPFPSLLEGQQLQAVLHAASEWQAELARLQSA